MHENHYFEGETNLYHQLDIKPCDKKKALQLLSKFYKNYDNNASIKEFFPAIKNGIMKLGKKVRPHDEAIKQYKEIIENLDYKSLCHAFIYGITHKAPEYRTPLIAYFYIKNMPIHHKENYKMNNQLFDEWCDICEMKEPKDNDVIDEFISINYHMKWLYVDGAIHHYVDFDRASIIIDEFIRLPKVVATKEDFNLFLKTLKLIVNSDKVSVSKYREILYSSKLLPMTKEQVGYYIDLLGYLNILHHPNTKGIAAEFTDRHEKTQIQINILGDKTTDFAYPVQCWNSSYGIDNNSIKYIFENMFDD